MHVIVRSPGDAGPAAAAAVAQGLGLPLEWVVQRIYRAPASLLGNLPEAAAHAVLRLVRGLGVEADLGDDTAVPPPPVLLDVAARVLDGGRIDDAAAVVAEFLGLTVEQALAQLLTPPGMLMGQASEATVAALRRRLPEGVLALAANDPARARYAWVARSGRATGTAALGAWPEGVIDADLDRAAAERLHARRAGPDDTAVVDQSLLEFDVQLRGLDPQDARQAEALKALWQVPEEDHAELASLLPVALEEGLGLHAAQARTAAGCASGLNLRARLVSFRRYRVVLDPAWADAAAHPAACAPMGRVQALCLRQQFEARGTWATLQEVPS